MHQYCLKLMEINIIHVLSHFYTLRRDSGGANVKKGKKSKIIGHGFDHFCSAQKL